MASVRCGHHAIRSHEPRAAVRAEYMSSPRGRRAYSTGGGKTKPSSKRHRGSRGSHRRTSQPSLTTRPTNAHTHKRETSPEPTEPADRTSRRTTNAHHARIAAPGLTQYQVLAPGGYSVIAAVRCPVLAPSVPRVMVNRRECFEFRRRLGLHTKSQYRIRSASLKCRLRHGSC